jgi:hypothetical protein
VPSRSVGYMRAKSVRTRSARRWTVTPTSSHQPISLSQRQRLDDRDRKDDVVDDALLRRFSSSQEGTEKQRFVDRHRRRIRPVKVSDDPHAQLFVRRGAWRARSTGLRVPQFRRSSTLRRSRGVAPRSCSRIHVTTAARAVAAQHEKNDAEEQEEDRPRVRFHLKDSKIARPQESRELSPNGPQ